MKQFNKKIFTFIILATAPLAFAFDASNIPIPTQIPDLQEQIDSTIEPQYPRPGDTVKITLEAYGTDLNNSSITWSVDGKILQQGAGVKTFSIVAGKAGQVTTVTATIAPPSSKIVTETFTINPQTVDLIWEAHTYTPPFYKGKAMYTPQEKVTFVAMPNIIEGLGSLVDPRTITYKWRQDNSVMGDYSGYGLQSYSYTGSILMSPVDMDIEATSPDGSVARNYLTLTPTFPELSLYENSSLYGILFNNEVSGGFEFGDKEERSVSAFPYFFGTDSKGDNNLGYKWTINGNNINVPQSQNDMTFRNTKNVEGKSIIGLSVANSSNFLQSATGGTVIDFQKPKKVFSF